MRRSTPELARPRTTILAAVLTERAAVAAGAERYTRLHLNHQIQAIAGGAAGADDGGMKTTAGAQTRDLVAADTETEEDNGDDDGARTGQDGRGTHTKAGLDKGWRQGPRRSPRWASMPGTTMTMKTVGPVAVWTRPWSCSGAWNAFAAPTGVAAAAAGLEGANCSRATPEERMGKN